ncbi:MAG: phosphopyruvate hydratase [Planctomycetaceae bacterium]
MPRIQQIHAREVFDSRGRPTVEVEVTCAEGRPARAIVPSGASTGTYEARELRDSGELRLGGAGVRQAVNNIRHDIAAALLGRDAADQQAIDAELCALDGTPNKSRLGANAALGVSLAVAYAAADALDLTPAQYFRQLWQQVPPVKSDVVYTSRVPALEKSFRLPLPMVNMISGGLHAGGNLDFQDFLVLPIGATTYTQALDWIVTIYHRLGTLLGERGYEGTLVGDEGGYGPRLGSNSEAVDLLLEAIEQAGYRPGDDVAIGLDVASSHFYKEGAYHLEATGGSELSSDEMVDLLERWVESYPIISIEDALAEDDWEGWQNLTNRLGDRVQLIGDDLFVTHPERLTRGITSGAGNSILIKLNQIGTLWETLETMRLAVDSGFWPVISARSGESEDTTIADLVVGTGIGQLKVGSVARSERLAKYNQLLRLEEQLADDAEYIGGQIFSSLSR